MANNLGLIITASDHITPNMSKERQDDLKSEYIRRASNRSIMEGVFNRNRITPMTLVDPTREELEASIDLIASLTNRFSYTYIYINCHGSENAIWVVLNKGQTISLTYSTLRTLLDKIPGRKVLLIESCHSGASITDSFNTAANIVKKLKAVNQNIINTFKSMSSHLRTGEFRGDDYLVVTACHSSEYAWGNDSGNYFTKEWAMGAGWNYSQQTSTTREADFDKDGYVSISDLCKYTANQHHKNDKYESDQNDMCYPENSTVPIFGDVPIVGGKEYTVDHGPLIDYYNAVGGENGEFGFPVGKPVKKGNILFQDFMGGVIALYPDGTVRGFSRLRYILKHIKQVGKILDKELAGIDNNLELYIRVSMNQDDSVIVSSKRWPDISTKTHGGTEFDIVYSGKSVRLWYPRGSNVYYDSLTLHGDAQIYLNVQVWDFEKYSKNEHIGDYNFILNIENGWGFKDIPLKYMSKTEDSIVKRYKEILLKDDKIRFDMSVKNLGPFAMVNSAIKEYYLEHGGEKGKYGRPVGEVETINGINYQNFAGGVIVQYKNGHVAGHSNLRYVLKKIRQSGAIVDGTNDNDLELYIRVNMQQDGKVIEISKRWPDYNGGKTRHGGKSFDIVYSGNAVSADHPAGTNVFYDSLVLRGESHIYLNIEIWDYDNRFKNEHIRDYTFDLNINNGWGFDLDIPQKFTDKFVNDSSAIYLGIYQPDDKIKLDMTVLNLD